MVIIAKKRSRQHFLLLLYLFNLLEVDCLIYTFQSGTLLHPQLYTTKEHCDFKFLHVMEVEAQHLLVPNDEKTDDTMVYARHPSKYFHWWSPARPLITHGIVAILVLVAVKIFYHIDATNPRSYPQLYCRFPLMTRCFNSLLLMGPQHLYNQ